MTHPVTNENPGARTPGLEPQTKILRSENSNHKADTQFLLRDALWEVAAILTGCGACAMAASGGGSLVEIEAALQSARLALIEAIAMFKELRAVEGAR